MRILVTRPREDAEALAAKLTLRGHEPIIEPLLSIVDIDAPLPALYKVQALLFTSANGVRAFARRDKCHDCPAFAVGEATAKALADTGFASVVAAGGDVEDLAAVVRARLSPAAGPLLHVAGTVVARDLGALLTSDGFAVERAVLYRADPATALSASTLRSLREGDIDAVLFFSPRTAATFVRLARESGVEATLEGVCAVGLSPAVIAAACEVAWADAIAADRPSEEELLAAIDRLAIAAAKTGIGQPTVDHQAGVLPDEGTRAMSETDDKPGSGPAPEPAPTSATVAGGHGDERHRRHHGWSVPVVIAVAVIVAGLAWTLWERRIAGGDAPAAKLAELDARLSAITERLDGIGETQGRQRADLDQRLAQLAGQLTQLEARVAALANRPAPPADADPELTKRIETLESELGKGQSASAMQTAALIAENRRLAGELARLQTTVAELTASLNERAAVRRSESLILAAGQLRQALERGGPFATELKAVRAIVGEDAGTLGPPLAALSAYAEKGIATRAALKQRFEGVAGEAVRRGQAGSGDDWWSRTLNRLMSLVVIRPVGEAAGDTVPARVARAEARLAADDLAGALAALDGVSGPAAAVIDPWTSEARARLAAETASAALIAQALQGGG